MDNKGNYHWAVYLTMAILTVFVVFLLNYSN